MTDVLIVGCGYVGRRVAALEQGQGHSVRAIVRSEASAAALRGQGIEAMAVDLDAPGGLPARPASTVYYFAPPPAHGVTDPRLDAFLAALEAVPPVCLVLLSTTGVYGDCQGAWVTEERPPNPQADRARRRLAAETSLLDWCEVHATRAVILRVPGIYGPGRLPEQRLREGQPVLREAESPFSNRIHVDDLAQACLAAARRGDAGAVYNISDGHPTTMTDYFFRVADLLGLARPSAISLAQAQQSLSPGMLSYLAESKRLDNRRMREELGVVLRYPDLAQGLPACLAP